MTKLFDLDGATLSQGIYGTVVKLRRIADSFERDGMSSSAGAMREAVEVIIELEDKLRRKGTRPAPQVLVNPDGPEAADRIEQLSSALKRMEQGLADIANGNAALEDGSDYARGWNGARFRMREIARSALQSIQVGGE